jgi:hypothetical protein
MDCDERILRELLSSPMLGRQVVRFLVEAADSGNVVVFHFEDGSTIEASSSSLVRELLRERLAWGDPSTLGD